MDSILLSKINKKIGIATQHTFIATTDRDTYFASHPLELKEELWCIVGTQIYQFQLGSWIEKTAIWKGVNGTNGTNGVNGTNGSSAYQIAVNNGFSGTEAEWLESLKGQDGMGGVVGSIFGRVGEVTAQSGDYNSSQISESTTKKFVSQAQIDSWDAIKGSLKPQGNWDCSTGVYPTTDQVGFYWICSVEGTMGGVLYHVNDWLIYSENGVWAKVNNADNVTSINGLKGAVSVTTDNIPDSTDKRYVSDAKLTVLNNASGTNTGDETLTTILSKLGINATTSKRKTVVINSDGTGVTTSIPILFLTTTERNAIGTDLPTNYAIYNTTEKRFQNWNGSAWTNVTNKATDYITVLDTGKVGINTNTPTADFEVNGYTKLGSDAPAFKVKEYTGVMPSLGQTIYIPHGLDQSKIASLNCIVNDADNTLRQPIPIVGQDIEYNIRIKNTSSIWLTTGINATLIAGRPYTVTIWYKA